MNGVNYNKIDRHLERKRKSKRLQKALDKLDRMKKLEKNDEDSDWITMNSSRFSHYNENFIKNCKNKLDSIKKDFDYDESKKYADVLEAIIYERGELANWFGDYSHTFKTSEYDDVFNGVDLYTEYHTNSAVLSYAIDVTFANRLDSKLKRIKNEIENGELTRIDFFVSEANDFVGRKSKIPRCILSVNKKIVDELIEKWIDGKSSDFDDDIIQFLILDQLKYQLFLFKKYANKLSESQRYNIDDKIIENYKKDMDHIDYIIDEKKELLRRDFGHLDSNSLLSQRDRTANQLVENFEGKETKINNKFRSLTGNSMAFGEYYGTKELDIMDNLINTAQNIFDID